MHGAGTQKIFNSNKKSMNEDQIIPDVMTNNFVHDNFFNNPSFCGNSYIYSNALFTYVHCSIYTYPTLLYTWNTFPSMIWFLSQKQSLEYIRINNMKHP